MDITLDAIVRHPSKPEWGYGRVLEILADSKLRVFFTIAGEKKLSMAYAPLTLADVDENTHKLLENISVPAKKKTSHKKGSANKYSSLQDIIDLFLDEFKEGFQGKEFMDNERGYKLKASTELNKTLARGTCSALIDSGDYAGVCDKARQLAGQTNLIYPQELILLNRVLKSQDNQAIFAPALCTLLYGESKYEERFEGFIKALNQIGAAKWTIATYYPFIMDPTKFMFLKPVATKNIAQTCGFNLNYSPDLNWLTYSKLQGFGEYLMGELQELNPQDMIDVQSFIWCTDRLTKNQYAKDNQPAG